MTAEERQFLTELEQLLRKYNASIVMCPGDGSDWYGITGEHIAVNLGKSVKLIPINEYDNWASATDIAGVLDDDQKTNKRLPRR